MATSSNWNASGATNAFSITSRCTVENAFVAPLAFQFELVAMNKKVQGYRPNLLGKPKYDDVWLES